MIVDALDIRESKALCRLDFPTPEIAGVKGAIVIPHLGASTAGVRGQLRKDGCSRELIDYLENGNITHSVNYPDCDMGVKGAGNQRITILTQEYPEHARSADRSLRAEEEHEQFL